MSTTQDPMVAAAVEGLCDVLDSPELRIACGLSAGDADAAYAPWNAVHDLLIGIGPVELAEHSGELAVVLPLLMPGWSPKERDRRWLLMCDYAELVQDPDIEYAMDCHSLLCDALDEAVGTP